MLTGWWVRRIFWIDGIATFSAGMFVLVFRRLLAGLYALPLDLITVVGVVNVGYSAFGLTLAAQKRRRIACIVGLSTANYLWALVCVWLAIRFESDANALGLAHVLLEGAFVAALATIEWRNRRALVEDAPRAT
jgi:hypothetical protein